LANKLEQEAAKLVEAVLDSYKILSEILDNFKKPLSRLSVLKQLDQKVFDLSPVEEAHGSGGHGRG